MKNKNSAKSTIIKIIKVIFFPITLLALLFKFIGARVEYSIRLKLSFRYFRILIGSMLAAGLGVIILFGLLTIHSAVSKDYQELAEIINPGQSDYAGIEKYSQEHNLPILIYDQNHNILFSSPKNLPQPASKSKFNVVRIADSFYLTISSSLNFSDTTVQVIIYSDIREELQEIFLFARIVGLILTAIFLIAVIMIFLSGRGIFGPIGEMTQTVKGISEKNLNLRINVSGSKNELKELALTFNEMMNRIEDQYNRQKQFVSDASHELRTPTAVIQGYAVMLDRWGKEDQAVLQESIDAIKNEAENMQELIDKLLFLARHDNSTFVLEKEEFSLTEMLWDIAKETQIIDPGHKINYEINKEVSFYGDKNRLKQAIRIFVDNAVKYTPAGGEVTLSLGIEGGFVTVSIKDTGIGMTKEELAHIFDRFYRADQSRTKEKGGHGLGLSIAKIIILGHNGKIKVRSKLGEGSEFIILLEDGTVQEANRFGAVDICSENITTV